MDTTSPYECPRFVLHITTRRLLLERGEGSPYRHPSLDAEGFIHTSTISQVTRTANRYKPLSRVDPAAQPGDDLFIAVIDTAALQAAGVAVKVEFAPAPGEWFPHVFGAIPAAAIAGFAPFDAAAVVEHRVFRDLPPAIARHTLELGVCETDRLPNALLLLTQSPHALPTEGMYEAPSLATEGFIHLATADTLLGVLNAFNGNALLQTGKGEAPASEPVTVNVIDRRRLHTAGITALRFEPAAIPGAPIQGAEVPSGKEIQAASATPPLAPELHALHGHLFPHLYAPLNVDAIVDRIEVIASETERIRRFDSIPPAIQGFFSK